MSNQPYGSDPRYPQQGYQQAQEPTEPVYDERVYRRNEGDGYVQSQQERYVGPNQVERREEVYVNPDVQRAKMRYWVAATIYFILSVLEIILLLRFIFRLLGANESNGFVKGLYDLSYVFMGPFKGIFSDPSFGQASMFEISTLIAMLIYALIAWGLVALSRVALGPTVRA
ncbi:MULTISPECIES: YggT family protein [Ktedonobacter]|uniref:YggT family protein n=1 Tax=Ktedonobacter racemifer DSM 44963 TaxID=485913 RepID=D6TFC5_KTERA|nr:MULTISPECIES: YggT family protein [Ktedonobacter]EFH88605.1 hypothetical protein Krac_10081 [Ktedonobacter racemifer DSM 44963]GHO67707.1 hypothetical protein KSC_065990 [Ktedonobacter sp. SOSP1-52]